MVLLILGLLLAVNPQEPAKPAVQVVLVVERNAAGNYAYTCNGRALDPKRVLSGVEPALERTGLTNPPMFVLFGEGVSLDKIFEIGSLFEGRVGLKDIRYFAFSRKTGLMQEVKPFWDRWELTFDGALVAKPW